MKIKKISLGCRSGTLSGADPRSDMALIFFRSSAIMLINGTEYKINGSSAVILSGGSRQRFRPYDGDTLKYDCLIFRMSSQDKQYLASLKLTTDTPIEIADDFVLSSMLKCMKAQSVCGGENLNEFMELSMRLIFLTISEAAERSDCVRKTEMPRLEELKELREAIYDDPMNIWSIDEMCSDMGISRAYFHRLYLAAFGVTCRQDIIESRLLYAAELLENTKLSVSAVAEQCGYESDSYFMRQFKQHKGCTPSEYRRRIIKT